VVLFVIFSAERVNPRRIMFGEFWIGNHELRDL
jgi:hypothetical protein